MVTSVGGPPLGSITNVFSDSGGTNIACAINASGSLWCWGNGSNGVLGNGYTYNSTFAVPVLSQSGGSQFTGVAQLAVSGDHACALKTNGTLWCWGNNTDGQLGLGTTQAQVLYPTQVTFPGDAMGVVNVVVTAGSSNTGPLSCAVTGDGRVWCWGSNESGALANGLTTGTATSPTAILTSGSDAAVDFGGAAEVQFYNSNTYGDSSPWVCVVVRKSADGSLWVWGNDTSSLFPQPYLEGEDVPVSGALSLAPTTEYSPEFIASDGTLHLLGGPAPVPLSCP